MLEFTVHVSAVRYRNDAFRHLICEVIRVKKRTQISRRTNGPINNREKNFYRRGKSEFPVDGRDTKNLTSWR